MPTRFVCLANSFKEGGRCIAGILLDKNNTPIIENGRPKWIRPISNTPHGEVPTHLVSHLNILDIVEIEIKNHVGKGYQSENTLFLENSIQRIGTYSRVRLSGLYDDSRLLIFGNKGKAVHEDSIGDLNHSLMFIRVTDFEIIEKIYEDNPQKKKIRLAFSYKYNRYEFPITDPVFLHNYQVHADYMNGVDELFLSLSLAINWEDWYYKLIAGIIHNKS